MELPYHRLEMAAHCHESRRLRVLVVSDDITIAAHTCLAARLARHHADFADINTFPLNIAHDCKPDVLILNVRSLKTRGAEFVRLIRSFVIYRPLRDVVIVAVSDADREKVSSKIDHLVKPGDLRGLQQLLAVLAENGSPRQDSPDALNRMPSVDAPLRSAGSGDLSIAKRK
jgi:DNA-binding response OmpR family regulator